MREVEIKEHTLYALNSNLQSFNPQKKTKSKTMTTPALPHEPDDPKNTFLRDNSRKKTYAEAIQDANMQQARYGAGGDDKEELPNQEEDIEQQIQLDDT